MFIWGQKRKELGGDLKCIIAVSVSVKEMTGRIILGCMWRFGFRARQLEMSSAQEEQRDTRVVGQVKEQYKWKRKEKHATSRRIVKVHLRNDQCKQSYLIRGQLFVTHDSYRSETIWPWTSSRENNAGAREVRPETRTDPGSDPKLLWVPRTRVGFGISSLGSRVIRWLDRTGDEVNNVADKTSKSMIY